MTFEFIGMNEETTGFIDSYKVKRTFPSFSS